MTEEYKEVRPYIKGAIAFLIWLRMPIWTRERCFEAAENWLRNTEGEK